jgi:hypothetical protein
MIKNIQPWHQYLEKRIENILSDPDWNPNGRLPSETAFLRAYEYLSTHLDNPTDFSRMLDYFEVYQITQRLKAEQYLAKHHTKRNPPLQLEFPHEKRPYHDPHPDL